MNDKMIIDFINNVKPDMTYGSSDGMTRAMVESAENMALINEYIVESTYEVYNESEDGNKESIIAKIKNKVNVYFTLLMNIAKKFIAKVKGFFVKVKTKLTAAMAKTTKIFGEQLKKFVKADKDTKKDVEIYKWNQTKFDQMKLFILKQVDLFLVKFEDKQSAEESNSQVEKIKSKFDDEFSKQATNDGILLTSDTITLSSDNAANFLSKEFKVNINDKINEMFDAIMKSTAGIITALKTKEKKIRADLKQSTSLSMSDIKERLKFINKSINIITSFAYKAAQKIASACFKYYKKLVSAIRSVIKGASSSTASVENNKSSNESSSILDMVQ